MGVTRATRLPASSIDDLLEFVGNASVAPPRLLRSDLGRDGIEGLIVPGSVASDQSFDVISRASHSDPR